MNIFGPLSQAARRYPNPGAVYLGIEQIADFAQLENRARRLGAALAIKARPDGRILIASKNCPEFLELLFGAWAAGLVVVPVNAKLHAKEIAQIITDCEPKRQFMSESLFAQWRAAGLDAAEITVIASRDFKRLFEGPSIAPVERGPEDLAWLFITSGTTGCAKGAMLTHRNLLSRDSPRDQRTHASLHVEGLDSCVNGVIEIVGVGEGLVGEMERLEIVPDDLDVIEFGRIFGEPFDGEPVFAGFEGFECELAGVDRPVVLDEHDGRGRASRPRTIKLVELFEMGDEVAGPFARARMDDERKRHMIERADDCDFPGLSWRRYPQELEAQRDALDLAGDLAAPRLGGGRLFSVCRGRRQRNFFRSALDSCDRLILTLSRPRSR